MNGRIVTVTVLIGRFFGPIVLCAVILAAYKLSAWSGNEFVIFVAGMWTHVTLSKFFQWCEKRQKMKGT